MVAIPKQIQIQADPTAGLKVDPDPQPCSVSQNGHVEWSSGKAVKDWRVIFGANAPVDPKVASPKHKKLKLMAGRPEDLRHVKYVVVALVDGALQHKDPELIVDK